MVVTGKNTLIPEYCTGTISILMILSARALCELSLVYTVLYAQESVMYTWQCQGPGVVLPLPLPLQLETSL